MEANNIQAAIDAGKEIGAKPDERVVMVGGLPVLVAPNSMQARLLSDVVAMEDAREAQPRRLKGTAVLTEIASFIAHVNRHKSAASVVFADVPGVKLTAVLNYNEAGAGDDKARWSDHRAVYACPLSEAWKRWTEHNDEEMSQDEFAQFIEDHMDDLASPTGNGDDKDLPMPSEVLTMARNLVVNTKGAFQRQVDPVTGNYTMFNKTENDTGTTKIPRAFLLKLQVFEAGAFWAIQARVRFQLNGGVPCFSYLLYRAEETKREAFDEVRKMVEQQTSLPVAPPRGCDPGPSRSSREPRPTRCWMAVRALPVAETCPNHPPGEKRPPATVLVSTRKYCRPCAEFLLRPVLVARVKRKGNRS